MADPGRTLLVLRIVRATLSIVFGVLATFALFEGVHVLAGHDYVAALLLAGVGVALAGAATTLLKPELAE